MNLARKATFLAVKVGCALTLSSLMCLVWTESIATEPAIAKAVIAEHGRTERVNVSSAGTQANGYSAYYTLSADGRFIAFWSVADNLVLGDTNGMADVFVHDRKTKMTELVSVNSAGAQINQDDRPTVSTALSADGRFVAFNSSADNLVPGDTNSTSDIFVHDRKTGMTERVSVNSAGTQGNGYSYRPALSADGRFVAFNSFADNLVPGDTNATWDIFVHDRKTGVTERVSVNSAGEQANGESGYARRLSLSANGRFIAFWSVADNLVLGDTNGMADIFVHDRKTGVTERVSVDSAGEQANGGSEDPALSADGRFVAFSSPATNLVSGDTNSASDIFVHDRKTGVTERVSVNSAGTQANGASMDPNLSAKGRSIAFMSYADNLVANDTNGDWDIFVHDRETESGPAGER